MSTRFFNLTVMKPSNPDELTQLVGALSDRAREMGIQWNQSLKSLDDVLALFFDDILVVRHHTHLLNSPYSLEELTPVLSILVDTLTTINLWTQGDKDLDLTEHLVQA